MIRLLMPLLLMLFISACGKTGALYLPADDKQSEESPVLKSKEIDRGSL